MKALRFGGISPAVLRELSGVYQPFVKAVKEIISNSYDADAETVTLEFGPDFESLTIKDDGIGMGPIEFVRDYIRIGKSHRKDEVTPIKGRPRIGGKGIGFLAPARYCEMIELTTKKNAVYSDKIIIEPNGELNINLERLFMHGHEDEAVLGCIDIIGVTDEQGFVLPVDRERLTLNFHEPVYHRCEVWYEYDASNFELTAKINFDALFSLETSKSLEQIESFCEISIDTVSDQKKYESYTQVRLNNIKEFVKNDLKDEGKKGARNIGSQGGLEQFEWHLSRIIPVHANFDENLPAEMQEYIRNEIDHNHIKIIMMGSDQKPRELKRRIINPALKLSMDEDKDILKQFDLRDENGEVFGRGFLVGQSSLILPAELRGILVRVKGVAVGEPTFFGLDQILSGPLKMALTQISGEINIFRGIDAVQDINPGRDGFYKESKTYNLMKKQLVGEYSDRAAGIVKEVINGIISRSEINSSLTNFLKKYQSYRDTILEASQVIANLAMDNPEIEDAFYNSTDMSDLKLSPAVLPKAEGKLSSFSVYEEEDLEDAEKGYKVNYETKQLFLDKKANIWKRNINIGRQNFDIELKHGNKKNVKMFCQVNPITRKIYINWDHPIRSSMGDTQFIKHCLATIASNLPQDQLDTYVSLMTSKV
ncbi:ATP-binding protein [Paenibacillus validus]|uniref:ATP-binding protein n=1 Tax=Paenibacillus validus TaxID=44253 RepID=UPI003D2D0206